jgi:PEP-CTERM motif-containing protein
MHKTLLAVLLAATATAGQASVTINFDTPGNTDPGTTASFGSPAVVATGYECTGSVPCGTTDLYIKDLGPGEQGLGLNNDPTGQHELWGPPLETNLIDVPVIQLDVTALLGLTSSASFAMNSTTNGEWWAVFGSNDAGVGSAPDFLGWGNDELSHDFANWGSYKYYDFLSLGTYTGGTPDDCGGGCTITHGNVLLASLTYTPSVPEPSTWAMMLLGFGAMGVAFRWHRRTTVKRPQIA